MKSPLCVLHLEDDPNDAALVQSTLEAGGIHCAITCVQNEDAFVTALEYGAFDLILSDVSLPAFDGLSALGIARERWPLLPVILVSGTLGEETAIDTLKSGATDYVLKGRLVRLVPAVRRAIEETEARAASERLKVQFIEAQKMEVVGQLAGGVAHDFNNILAVIMFCGNLIAAELDPGSPLRKYTEEIRHATERAVGLTRQLLIFSRKQAVQPVVIDLNEVVAELDQMLGRLVGENIELSIIPAKDIGHIRADTGYVGQVLMNLVVNARDAMPDGGILTIATGNGPLDEGYAHAHPGAHPGDWVTLSVRDTGTGMTDEVKAHLFEAFYTTKPQGVGTGLGLATCHTIVQESGGHIGVESEPGKGTTFRIYFPRVEAPLDAVARPSHSGPMPHGTETLLVVEDDAAVRNLARGILEALGYEVLLAANGQDAMRVVRDHKGAPIQLVVTDVIMPQMGGKVMMDWLHTADPGLKVLFTSGYLDDAIAHHGVLEPGVAFLPKPYTPGVLARRVRDILDAGPPPLPGPQKGAPVATAAAA
jgi:signal transduction histidine kinase